MKENIDPRIPVDAAPGWAVPMMVRAGDPGSTPATAEPAGSASIEKSASSEETVETRDKFNGIVEHLTDLAAAGTLPDGLWAVIDRMGVNAARDRAEQAERAAERAAEQAAEQAAQRAVRDAERAVRDADTAVSLQPLTATLEALALSWAKALEGTAPVRPIDPDACCGDAFARDYLPTPAAQDVERMSDTGLIDTTRTLFDAFTRVQALLVRTAGEIAHRSRRELGVDGVARKAGHPNAPSLVAELGRVPFVEGQKLCRVGLATGISRTFLGSRSEPVYPVLALAIDAGRVGVASAVVILSHLSQASPRASRPDMEAAEDELTQFAASNLPEVVSKLAIAWRDAMDTDGITPREEELTARRSLVWRKLANGMEQCTITLDPLGAGFLHTVISARVGDSLRGVHFTDGRTPLPPCPVHANRNTVIDCGCSRPGVDSTTGEDGTAAGAASTGDRGGTTDAGCETIDLADLRTIPQRSYDALIETVQHVLGCTKTEGTLPHTTLVIRMNLDALTSAVGTAHIDGIDEPISAHTARILAADAHLIPQVLGGNSAILDQGTGRRLFSKAQRLALAERDGGCAVTGCPHPPSYTEAHHLDWWARDHGPTDLGNGILLCTHHHHDVHRQRWEIEIIDNVPWFIPPADIDYTRTPRRGGRPPTPLPPTLSIDSRYSRAAL